MEDQPETREQSIMSQYSGNEILGLFDLSTVSTNRKHETKLTKKLIRQPKTIIDAATGHLSVSEELFLCYDEVELYNRSVHSSDLEINLIGGTNKVSGDAPSMPSLRLHALEKEYREPVRNRDKNWKLDSQRDILDGPKESAKIPLGRYRVVEKASPLFWSPSNQTLIRKVKLFKTSAIISETSCIVEIFGVGINGRLFSDTDNSGRLLIFEVFSLWNLQKEIMSIPCSQLSQIFVGREELLKTGRKRDLIPLLIQHLYYRYTVLTTVQTRIGGEFGDDGEDEYHPGDDKDDDSSFVTQTFSQSVEHLDKIEMLKGYPQTIAEIMRYRNDPPASLPLDKPLPELTQELNIGSEVRFNGPVQRIIDERERKRLEAEEFERRRLAWLAIPLRLRGLLSCAAKRRSGLLFIVSAYNFPKRPMLVSIRGHINVDCTPINHNLSLGIIQGMYKIPTPTRKWTQEIMKEHTSCSLRDMTLVGRTDTLEVRLSLHGIVGSTSDQPPRKSIFDRVRNMYPRRKPFRDAFIRLNSSLRSDFKANALRSWTCTTPRVVYPTVPHGLVGTGADFRAEQAERADAEGGVDYDGLSVADSAQTDGEGLMDGARSVGTVGFGGSLVDKNVQGHSAPLVGRVSAEATSSSSSVDSKTSSSGDALSTPTHSSSHSHSHNQSTAFNDHKNQSKSESQSLNQHSHKKERKSNYVFEFPSNSHPPIDEPWEPIYCIPRREIGRKISLCSRARKIGPVFCMYSVRLACPLIKGGPSLYETQPELIACMENVSFKPLKKPSSRAFVLTKTDDDNSLGADGDEDDGESSKGAVDAGTDANEPKNAFHESFLPNFQVDIELYIPDDSAYLQYKIPAGTIHTLSLRHEDLFRLIPDKHVLNYALRVCYEDVVWKSPREELAQYRKLWDNISAYILSQARWIVDRDSPVPVPAAAAATGAHVSAESATSASPSDAGADNTTQTQPRDDKVKVGRDEEMSPQRMKLPWDKLPLQKKVWAVERQLHLTSKITTRPPISSHQKWGVTMAGTPSEESLSSSVGNGPEKRSVEKGHGRNNAPDILLALSNLIHKKICKISSNCEDRPTPLLECYLWQQEHTMGVVAYDLERGDVYEAQPSPAVQHAQLRSFRFLEGLERVVMMNMFLALTLEYFETEDEEGNIHVGIRFVEGEVEVNGFNAVDDDYDQRTSAALQDAQAAMNDRMTKTVDAGRKAVAAQPKPKEDDGFEATGNKKKKKPGEEDLLLEGGQGDEEGDLWG